MTENNESPYAALERVFHEPGRLAIMSSLCGAPDGMRFTDLKKACSLTDGNLNRHLKTLGDAGAVRIKKRFEGAKPRTTVFVTDSGRQGFLQSLKALEAVLEEAVEKAKAVSPSPDPPCTLPSEVRPERA